MFEFTPNAAMPSSQQPHVHRACDLDILVTPLPSGSGSLTKLTNWCAAMPRRANRWFTHGSPCHDPGPTHCFSSAHTRAQTYEGCLVLVIARAGSIQIPSRTRHLLLENVNIGKMLELRHNPHAEVRRAFTVFGRMVQLRIFSRRVGVHGSLVDSNSKHSIQHCS